MKPGIHPLASVGNDPEHRAWLGDRLAASYPCDIDPSAQVNAFVTIDAGTWRRTHVGARALLMAHSHVGHDAIVGDDCDLAPGCVVGGSAEIGNRVKLGINSTVLPFRKVGDGATVGAGAVVTKNVAPGAIVVGNPARPIHRNPVAFSERGEGAEQMAWHHAENWRWEPRWHSTPTTATITVSGLSAEQMAESEKKLKQGAHLVPFGFARVLQATPEPPQRNIPQEPLRWEGDDS